LPGTGEEGDIFNKTRAISEKYRKKRTTREKEDQGPLSEKKISSGRSEALPTNRECRKGTGGSEPRTKESNPAITKKPNGLIRNHSKESTTGRSVEKCG